MDFLISRVGNIVYKLRYLLLLLLITAIVYVVSLISNNIKSGEVVIVTPEGKAEEIVVEIGGGVEKPGVYKMKGTDRIEDLLVRAGGLSANADRSWVEKNINRARILVDGEKVYIKSISEQLSDVSAKNIDSIKLDQGVSMPSVGYLVDINKDDAKTLESLPGIGPKYASKIIEQRPYSKLDELVSKGAIPASIYEKLKNLIKI